MRSLSGRFFGKDLDGQSLEYLLSVAGFLFLDGGWCDPAGVGVVLTSDFIYL